MTEVTSVNKKLAIIDGKSVFYRGYYAMPNLSTKDGTPTGGVYGFCALALELIKRLKPDYVCVAWDKPKTNIRKRLAIYPDYKAGRKPAPADFYVQIPILHEVLEAFNWPLYELDDYEADDIMCGLSKKAAAEGIETMLISSDLDMLQCISPLTHMYALKKGLTNIERFDIDAFEEKYGIKIDQFLDLKSIKGDGSDNIPGVPGIGEKGAVDLLKQFETLDGVYENVALIKDSLAKKLIAGRESAYMSREVARLFDDAPIELDLAEMDVNKLDTVRLEQILKRLEFKSLLRNLPEGMQATAEQKSEHKIEGELVSGGIVDLHEKPVVHINSSDELVALKLEGDVVLHARSQGKHGRSPSVLILADSEHTYVADLRKFKLQDLELNFNRAIGYDLKNSFKVLLELGVTKLPVVAHDTLIAGFIINAIAREQTLTDIAARDIGFEGDVENMDDDQLIERAAEVASVIRAISVAQGEQMSEVTSLIKLADEVDYPVIPVLARMERVGIKIIPSIIEKFADELADEISDIEQTIYGLADEEFNLNSPSQVSAIFFDKLELPTFGIKKLKSGFLSTDSSTLAKLAGKHELVDEFIKYREYAKLKNTYADTLPKMADYDSRIRTTFNMTIAPTGRLSSVDPNLQQIPIRTALGRRIRAGFVAEEGNVFVSADYSQFELRIAAAMSGDQGMIDAFNTDSDIHTQTAALIHGITNEEVTKEMRYAAKAVNFGILYGQGTFGLSSGTGISMAEAKEFIAKYFEVRPKLKGMIELFRSQAKDRGYVETICGRRRPTPDAQSANFMVREGAYRAAVNMPIQGGAADLTKLAMIKLDQQFDHWNEDRRLKIEDELPQSPISNPRSVDAPRQLLQIHDSIMVECRAEDAEHVAKMMKETMENIYPNLGVNLKVDVNTGKTWGDL